MPLLTQITDLEQQADLLRPRSHGVIEVEASQLVSITLRPWPKVVSLAEARIAGELYHRFRPGNRCWMYFNQPRAFPNFLVLKYTLTAAGASWATFFEALTLLDQIAAIKRSDAILCEASNRRISDRLLRRHGWEPHCPNSRRRNFIKRFAWPSARIVENVAGEMVLA